MARLAREAGADPDFRSVADRLGGLDTVEAFIRSRYQYRDEDEEIVRTPQFMLADMGRVDATGRIVGLEGDCDDVSTLFAGFCCALGYPCRFVAIRYTPDVSYFEHVFLEAYDGGQWRTLDATVAPGTMMQWLEEIKEGVNAG